MSIQLIIEDFRYPSKVAVERLAESATILQANEANSIDRGKLFGDGFFTTGKISNGKIEFFERHKERLVKSALVLSMPQFSINDLAKQLDDIVQKVERAVFRLTVSRQQVERGYAISSQATISYVLALYPLPIINSSAKHNQTTNNYCDLIFAKTPISVNPLLAGIKHLNRLDNVLAASEVSAADQESLMFDGEQFVICGSRTNLFLKIQGRWCTPNLNKAGVVGITYQRVLKLMEKQQIACHHREIHRDELIYVESAFVTNSLIGVWPAKALNGIGLSLQPAIFIKEQLK